MCYLGCHILFVFTLFSAQLINGGFEETEIFIRSKSDTVVYPAP